MLRVNGPVEPSPDLYRWQGWDRAGNWQPNFWYLVQKDTYRLGCEKYIAKGV